MNNVDSDEDIRGADVPANSTNDITDARFAVNNVNSDEDMGDFFDLLTRNASKVVVPVEPSVLVQDSLPRDQFDVYIPAKAPKRHRKLAKEVVRSYKCPHCPKAYGAEKSMLLHIKRKHS